MPAIAISKLRECLLDIQQPVAQRTHAAFVLRTNGNDECVDVICEALNNKADSALMRHELAYILGQMQNLRVAPILSSVLSDETDDILVRHESAEALGALGHEDFLPILEQFSQHSAPEISETCQIAVDRIQWKKLHPEKNNHSGGYLSVDPAPPFLPGEAEVSIETLRSILIDPSQSLFHRYRAMFSLRNMNNDAAALALLDGFQDTSALFRHEIAYVLGQMSRPVTIEGLTNILQNISEHRMVRHEAAEALGAVGGEVVEIILQQYMKDEEIVVQESCHVALDTIEYWTRAEFDQI
jgi:deoxyhypusine monooxygenase